MGLHGGGEESLTSGSTGWGSLPPMSSSSSEWGNSAPNNSNANHWPNNSRQISNCDQTISTSPKPSGSWAQAAGKGLNNGPNGPNHDLNAFGNNNGFQTNDNNSTKIRNNSDFGQTNSEIKDTALISDNWGSTVINQDSPWKLPPSPQSSPKECGSASQWKSSTSSGTEIWENTVRHKSKGPTPSPANTSSGQPWGHHTPSTHIGGTWGEEEDPSNHWTGVPQVNNAQNNWSGNVSNNTNNNNNNNNTNNTNNGNNNNPNNMQWNHTSDVKPNPENRHTENNSRHNSETRHNPENRPKVNQSTGWSDYNNTNTNTNTNEQNDSNGSEPVWTETKSNESFGTWVPESTQKKGEGWDKDSNDSRGSGNYDDGTAVWGNPVSQSQRKVSHWKENASGKAISGGPQSAGPHGNPNGNNPNTGMPGMIASSPGMIRLPPGAPISGKNADNWGKPSPPNQTNRGNSWSEPPVHRDSPSNSSGSLWCDSDNKNAVNRTPNTPNWVDSNSSPLAYWAAKPKATNNTNSNWSDGQIDTSSWCGPKQGKPLSRDIIWASKQFRILTDMGFKKDDVENALRNTCMKLEDAIIELKTASARDSNSMDLDGLQQRFKGSGLSSNTPSLLSNTSGIANSSLTSSINRNSLGSIMPPPHQPTAQTQSFTQANQVQSALGSNPGSRIGGSAQSNSLPNAAQLRVLVQQIQLAVQAGHLNAQILNQPLAPPTLQLLYQLLQQIKILHQLQISANQHLSKTGATNAAAVPALQSSINVQITQTKQRILNLQNQIAAQQAIFLKEQHQSQQIGPPSTNAVNVGLNANPSIPLHSQQTSNNDFFKSSHPDNSLVISNDRDLSSQSLSRFQTTWKPSFNKEDNKIIVNNLIPNEFSRAPGPLPKQTNSILSRNDLTNWSGFTGVEDSSGWPPDVNSISAQNIQKHELKEIPNSLSSAIQPSIPDAYNLNDLVPEFEPGKPWKGNSNLKNIEDDPTITPGSVNRSPLSINTIKDPLFNWPSKLSPGNPNSNAADSLLSSSTWAFTPPSNSHMYNTVDSNKPKNNLKSPSNWGALNAELQLNSCTDNLWRDGSVSKRGPPPGLTPQIKSPATTLPNSGTANSTVSSAHNLWNSDNRQNGSEFLLLRNLTPQIDGSTLKTLCLQHGPLQLFHLYLNHGIALARYSTREEAAKAQSALNNCVLGNTSILADIPHEAEAQQLMQLATGGGQQMTSNALNWSQNGQNSSSSNGVSQASSGLYRNANSSLQYAGNSNSTPSKMDSSTTSPGWNTSGMSLWPFSNSGNNLWSAPTSQDRSTPSSIQSLLPGDLLGGETN